MLKACLDVKALCLAPQLVPRRKARAGKISRARCRAMVTLLFLAACSHALAPPTIVDLSLGGDGSVSLAAKEVRHYIYSSSGQLSPIVPPPNNASTAREIIVVGATNHPSFDASLRAVLTASGYDAGLDPLPADVRAFFQGANADAHSVATLRGGPSDSTHVVGVLGATARAALYGAYTFAERFLGAQFLIHGDFIPRRAQSERLFPIAARVLETPAFAKRGLQPFHDFTSGPDWWSSNDYKAVLSQMIKLKMNFIGFHSYPMREPLVWVGTPGNLTSDGDVIPGDGAYKTTWASTSSGGWGLSARNTSTYAAGASQIFPTECYGSPAQPSMAACSVSDPNLYADNFNKAADLVGDAFGFATKLGIEKAVGTEVPLTTPAGVDPQTAFEGAFTRIAKKLKPEYIWHWTPEGWEWGKVGVNSTVTKQAVSDIRASIEARKAIGPELGNFTLATCGWLIGPYDSRAYFDDVLPGDIPVLSSIDTHVGWDPVDPAYASINREKWVIPWMEDDPGLIGAELWVNRTLSHSADAKKYGVNGLLGIHWRTLETSLTIRALAESAWSDSVSVEKLYFDFANATFGPAAAQAVADIFVSLDSFGPTGQPKLPRPSFQCCAKFDVPSNPIDMSAYAFADAFYALRDKISDPESLSVFDQWAFMLRYHRGIARVQNAALYLQANVSEIEKLPPAQQPAAAASQGISALSAASRAYEDMMTDLLTFASTPGELGLVAENENMNFLDDIDPSVARLRGLLIQEDLGTYVGSYKDSENRTMPYGPGLPGGTNTSRQACSDACYSYPLYALQWEGVCFCGNDLKKAESLGPDPDCTPPKTAGYCNAIWQHEPKPDPIPREALPTSAYLGPSRLFVLGVRTIALKSDGGLPIKAVLLTNQTTAATAVELEYRKLGASEFTSVAMPRVAAGRGWFSNDIDVKAIGDDFEYRVTATVGSQTLAFPPAGRTVVVVVA